MCKSQGGLTKHRRSKHVAELKESSCSNENIEFTLGKTCAVIRDIDRYLADEKLHRKEHIAEVFKLIPSDSFVTFVDELLLKFKRKQNKDKFLKEFYGTTNSNWKEYFDLYVDKKIVFLMLIHFPERLIGFLEQGYQEIPDSKVFVL